MKTLQKVNQSSSSYFTRQQCFSKFELFFCKTPYVYFAPQSQLVSCSTNIKNSSIVNVGHDGTWVVPIYNNYTLQHGVHKSELGGLHISK